MFKTPHPPSSPPPPPSAFELCIFCYLGNTPFDHVKCTYNSNNPFKLKLFKDLTIYESLGKVQIFDLLFLNMLHTFGRFWPFRDTNPINL